MNSFLTPTPVEWSFAALVEGILDSMDTAAAIIIDVVHRKVYFTDDNTKKGLLRNAANNGSSAKLVSFEPDLGQTGKSLLWGATGWNAPDQAFVDAQAGIVIEARPKKTIASLVAASINAVDVNGVSKAPKVIMVDQFAKQALMVSDDVTEAVAAVTLDAGNSGLLVLSEPAGGGGTETQLPFEGGAV